MRTRSSPTVPTSCSVSRSVRAAPCTRTITSIAHNPPTTRFPTVMHIAAVLDLREQLQPALTHLHGALSAKAAGLASVLKIGRTHLMDAVPMTMGQAFDAFAQQVAFGMERIEAALPRLRLLPQGGTAVGTGLNAPAGFDSAFCGEVSALTATTFRPNPSKFEGMGAHDAFVEASGALSGRSAVGASAPWRAKAYWMMPLAHERA